jgi:hypothetical protein
MSLRLQAFLLQDTSRPTLWSSDLHRVHISAHLTPFTIRGRNGPVNVTGICENEMCKQHSDPPRRLTGDQRRIKDFIS